MGLNKIRPNRRYRAGVVDIDSVFLEDQANLYPGAAHVRRDLAEATARHAPDQKPSQPIGLGAAWGTKGGPTFRSVL